MKKTMSLYLDGFRGMAALAVFLSHSTDPGMTDGFLSHLGVFGDDAVMAFFVLSGYVIAFSAQHKHDTLGAYCVARLSRLWSVVLPALLLTAVLDWMVQHLPGSNVFYRFDDSAFRYALSAIFANQIWFLGAFPGSNAPFWSLCFEVFYYAFFAAAYYLSGTTRWLVAVAILLIAGPKIVLFLPLWLLGVLAYSISTRPVGQVSGWCLWIGSWMGFGIYFASHAKHVIDQLIPHGELLDNDMFSNAQLCTKYLFSILVFVNIVGFQSVGWRFLPWLTRVEAGLRLCGRYSFSLYLYHSPLLVFFMALTWSGHGRWWSIAVIYVGTLSFVALLATYTESRKDIVSRALSHG